LEVLEVKADKNASSERKRSGSRSGGEEERTIESPGQTPRVEAVPRFSTTPNVGPTAQ
jgi:hypothetical protein